MKTYSPLVLLLALTVACDGGSNAVAPLTERRFDVSAFVSAIEVIATTRDGIECLKTTFEGGLHRTAINPEEGGLIAGSNMRFPPIWVTLTDVRAYSNEPSPVTVVAWLDGFATITFDQPVSAVSLFFASFETIRLEAYDAGGKLVASASGSPTGNFRRWASLGVAVDQNAITRVLVHGRARGVIVDDVENCRIVEIEVDIDIKPGSDPNSINLRSAGSVPVAILGSETFDVTSVDPATVTLAGAPVMVRRNGTLMASLEDVNRDGRIDLVVHVETEQLELSSDDTEAVLRGRTLSGIGIRGVDAVRIVGSN